MSKDLSADYIALKVFNAEKKANNLKASTKLLDTLSIDYTSHNNGIHLRVANGEEVIDFWPSTGKWKAGDHTDRGVQKLIAYIRTGKL